MEPNPAPIEAPDAQPDRLDSTRTIKWALAGMWLAFGALGFSFGLSDGGIVEALTLAGIFLMGGAMSGFFFGGVLVQLMKFVAQRPIALTLAVALAAVSMILEVGAVIVATIILYPPSPTAPPSNTAGPSWIWVAAGGPIVCLSLFLLLKFRVRLSAARSAAVALSFTIVNVALMVVTFRG